ncbi:MAG: hypothetical protein LBP55_10095 [Candidatus Adiutrix sp.]|nr:hypothetical protein [Candidatus Adiutrix sp.]
MRGKVLRNQIWSITISLALSFFLWLALAGHNTSTISLSLPLELTNLPETLARKSNVPEAITVQIQANAAQRRFLDDFQLSVKINVASAREGHNTFPVVPDLLALPRGVQIQDINPAVVEFEAVKIAHKIVPLEPRTYGHVQEGFRLKAVTTDPDMVNITGPLELLQPIHELATTQISLEGLSGTTTILVTPVLTDLDPSLDVTPREIKVTIEVVEQTLEHTFSNLPIGVEFKGGVKHPALLNLYPDRAEIEVSWPISRTRPVTAADIQVRVPAVAEDKLLQSGQLTLPVTAVVPNGVTLISIKPPQVTVTLKEPK